MSDRYKGAILSPTAPTVTPQSAGGIYTSSQQLQYQGQGVWPQAVNNPLTNSLRFRRSATAYLNRTPASAGNRTTYTWSGWIKLGLFGAAQEIFGAGTGATQDLFNFNADNQFVVFTANASQTLLRTAQLFRDPSAWYHIVVAVDTTQATSSNRTKIYVNGVQVTAFEYTQYPSQNYQGSINNTGIHYISTYDGSNWAFDGYLAEINFVDGTQLTPSSFGTTDAYGIWQPIPYTGAYGTNGFYLPFTDNSALTTSSNVGLGKDFSGNGNYWVTNNISITAGSTYDSMTDVPTNTNSNTANYPTLNPLYPPTGAVGLTWSNGNLNLATVNSGAPPTESSSVSTMYFPPTGKFYAEMTVGTILGSGSNSWPRFGVAGYGMGVGGFVNFGGSSYTTFSTGDIMSVAWDAASGQIWWGKNGTWLNSGNPAAGTGSISTFTYDQNSAYVQLTLFFSTTGSTAAVNFGQRPFAYTPPSGFYPLNTYNLPTPTILDGENYFETVTWTGTGSNLQIPLNFTADFVWAKRRNGGDSHRLYDVIRGINNDLQSNSTDAQQTNDFGLSFGVGNYLDINGTKYFGGGGGAGITFVGWNWRANGTGVSNTQGTITSTVSANTTSGFSIVTYTGTGGSGTTTVGHGLGVAPSMVIVKSRSDSYNWAVYHTGLTSTSYYLILNSAAGQANYGSTFISPSSSTLTIDAGSSLLNQSTRNYVAYVFSQVAGYSAFGSYTGNGSTDGPFIYTGFRPAFILTKNITTGGYWWEMVDDQRSPYNTSDKTLYANVPDSEYTSSTYNKDLVSNGFKIRGTSAAQNSSGDTYIYMAFAENPFKIARGR